MKRFLLLPTLSHNYYFVTEMCSCKCHLPFNVIKILISMIDTHRKDSGLKLAFCATTRIFPKERKLFNVTLFVPLACISNFCGCDFVLFFF